LTLPNVPINLVDIVTITNKDRIGLDWEGGDINAGGTHVIDYRIWIATGYGSQTY